MPVAAQPFTYTYVETDLPPLSYGALGYADVDGDGDFDLVAGGNANRFSPFQPFSYVGVNLGKATENDLSVPVQPFTINPTETALWHNSIAWADYDGDGDLDFVMSGTTRPDTPFDAVTHLYRNDGNGQFQEIDAGLVGLYSASAAWGDYDNDGDADLLMVGMTASEQPATVLYRNQSGTFEDVETSFVDLSYGDASWADYDGDGDLDALLLGATADGRFTTRLYRNDGNGRFTDREARLPGLVFGSAAWGDFNHDGDLDLVLSGGQIGLQLFEGRTRLYTNENGLLVERSHPLGGTVAGQVDWGDYDNDGDLDLLVVGAREVSGFYLGRVYENDNGLLTHVLNLPGLLLASAAWADGDGDGDLDLLLAGIDNRESLLTSLYRNDQAIVNTPPTAPTDLQTSQADTTVMLSWAPGADDQTPSPGLTHNLRVGTSASGTDIVAPMAEVASGQRWIAQRGNVDHNTQWHLQGLPPGTYYWSVQAIDASYLASPFADEATFTVQDRSGGNIGTGTNEDSDVPTTAALHAAYPNPFRSAVTLAYEVPATSPVSMKVYNVLGTDVQTLIDQILPAGRHQVRWDGQDRAGRRVATGIYFVRLRIGTETHSQRLIVVN